MIGQYVQGNNMRNAKTTKYQFPPIDLNLLVVDFFNGMDGMIQKLVNIQFLELKYRHYNAAIFLKIVIVVKKRFFLEVILCVDHLQMVGISTKSKYKYGATSRVVDKILRDFTNREYKKDELVLRL